ncbi:hypothetical protein CYMTET_48800 [Cymbomonas tetramitiformis]|uniref:L domain-like protein n=1 Tax=Cymbomonas tetramitiformis TaxID=36881 RepID=A0AAE0EWG5_9CHLO|nr:hypothetical protein CYMTET_48800 [Cymbomonas tetramitiformis]
MSDIDSTQESMEDARQEAEHLWIAGLQGEGATEGFAGEHGGCMAGGGAALDCGGQGEGAFEGLAGEHGGFLFYNSLTGTLPTELGELTSLDHMELNHNSMTGTVPTELGELTSIAFLLVL